MTSFLDFVRWMGQNAGEMTPPLEILLRLTMILFMVLLAVLILRRSSAALRHWIWALSLVGALLLPFFYGFFPAWQWAILPQQPSASSNDPVAKVESGMDSSLVKTQSSPTEASLFPDTRTSDSLDGAAMPPMTVVESSRSVSPTENSPAIVEGSALNPKTTALAKTPEPTRSTWSWAVFFVMLWVSGTSLWLVWLMLGIAVAWHVVRRARPVENSSWSRPLQQLASSCKIRRPVSIRTSSQVSVPMTWGLRRPVILIPAGSEDWSSETKRSVLLHELAHIRRGDCLTHLLGRLTCAVYWFHPLVWLAAKQLRKTSEQAADDMVLASDIAPPDYAEQLVTIASQARGLRLLGHVALPMANPSDLETRVLAILDPRRNHRSLTRKTCYALIVLALLVLIPGALLKLGYAEAAKPAKDQPTATSKASTKEEKEKSVSELKLSPRELSVKRSETAEKLERFLTEKRFDDIVKMFDPTLKKILPASKLEAIWEKIEHKHGAPYHIQQVPQRFGTTSFVSLQCYWYEEPLLEMRFAFDRHARISGLWIVNGASQGYVDFPSEGYLYGTVVEEAAKADLTLNVVVLGLDGKPMKPNTSRIPSLWIVVDEAADDAVDDKDGLPCWHDSATGKTWRLIDCGNEIKHLVPGEYRLAVSSMWQANVPPLQVSVSDPFRLDGTKKQTEIKVRMQTGPTLTFRPVDAATGKPIPKSSIVITSKSDHVPPGTLIFPTSSESDSLARAENVPPGTYSISADRRTFRPDQLEYRLDKGPLEVKVVEGKDQEITLPMRGALLTEEEIAKRWPWVVNGRVTDEQGQPMEGVTVSASTGIGSLFGGGSTETDKDGRYTLRFAEGVHTCSQKPGEVPINMQCALIGARKPGFTEKNLSRQGDRQMARRLPRADEKYVWEKSSPPILPNRSETIDFVMVPSATVDVEVVDAKSNPITKPALWILGKILPPGCWPANSGKECAPTQVRFEDVPPDFAWWFSINTKSKNEAQSPSVIFSKSEKYKVRLRFGQDPSNDKGYLKILSVKNAKGEEVREQVLVKAKDKDEEKTKSMLKPTVYKPFPGDEKLTEEQGLFCRWDAKTFGLPDPARWAKLDAKEKAAAENRYMRQILSANEGERVEAIDALAGLGSKKAIPLILQIAADRKEKNNWDRHTAVRALGLLGDKSVVPELVHLTYHYNWNTREWAKISLLRLTGQTFGRDVKAWKTWWENQGGDPPLSDETIAWATSPKLLAILKGSEDPKKQDQLDRDMVERMKKMLGEKEPKKDEPSTPTSPKNPPQNKDASNNQRINMRVVIARHLMLLEGKEVVTWKTLGEKIAAMPKSSQVHLNFYITKGVREADTDFAVLKEIRDFRSQLNLNDYAELRPCPRPYLRYDQLKTANDLVLPESEFLRIEGKVVDKQGKPVDGAQVVLVTAMDESISDETYPIRLAEGCVCNPSEHALTRSDNEGKFVLNSPKGIKFYVLAMHPKTGFCLTQSNQLSHGGEVRLLPWAKLICRDYGLAAHLCTRVEAKGGLPEVTLSQNSYDLKEHLPGKARFPHVPPLLDTRVNGVSSTMGGRSFLSYVIATVRPLPDEFRYVKPKNEAYERAYRINAKVVIARHLMLLEGKEVVTWKTLGEKIAALSDPARIYPSFYITNGARKAGLDVVAKKEIEKLRRRFELEGYREGNLSSRSGLRYDIIQTAEDLVPDENLRVNGKIVDKKGKPVAGAEVLIVTPIDQSTLDKISPILPKEIDDTKKPVTSYSPPETYDITLIDGQVDNPLDHIMTHTDAQGRFAVYPPKNVKAYLVAMHPTAGFCMRRVDLSAGSVGTQLIPWAKLESVADMEEMSLHTRVDAIDGLPEVLFTQSCDGLKKDSSRVFRFTQVPPTLNTTIYRSFRAKEGSYSIPEVTISFLPDESRRLDLGPLSKEQQDAINSLRFHSQIRNRNINRSASEEKPGSRTTSTDTPSAKETTAIEPALPMLTVYGRVVDEAAKPVAGAKVYLREWSTYRISSEPYQQNLNDVLATTHTDRDGSFRFENVPAKSLPEEMLKENPWDVVVVAESHAMAWRHLHAAKTSLPLEMVLKPEAKITGRVTDKQGKPVASANVEVYGIHAISGTLSTLRWTDRKNPEAIDLAFSRLTPTAKTDAKGNVEIAGLPSDALLLLTVTHEDHQRSLLYVATSDQPQPDINERELYGKKKQLQKSTKVVFSSHFSAVLEDPLPRIVGQVVAADTKKPLAKIKIMNISSLGTVTDQEGRFTIKDIAKSPCRLFVSTSEDNEYLGQLMLVDVPKEKRETSVRVELARGEMLSGMVTDSDTGKGVAGVSVSFDNGFDLNTSTKDGPLPGNAKTGKDGRFQLTLPPGKGKLRIYGHVPDYSLPFPCPMAAGDIEGFFKEIDVTAGKPTTDVRFTIHRGNPVIPPGPENKTIEGTVVDLDGKPAVGVDVGPDLWFRDIITGCQPVKTDANGHFSLQGDFQSYYSGGNIILVAVDKKRKLRGHLAIDLNAETKTTSNLSIQLLPTGVITGRVLEGDKLIIDEVASNDPIPGPELTDAKPLAGIRVQLDAHESLGRDFAITDEEGRFTFPFVEANHIVDLYAYSDRHMPGNRQTQAVPGKTTEVLPLLMMKLSKAVAGTVVDQKGNPVAGATITVETRSGKQVPSDFAQKTGNDGRFAIRGVPNVPLRLTAKLKDANSKGRTTYDSTSIEAKPGDLNVRIRFTDGRNE